MTDQQFVTLFAALTIALCLVSRLEGASSGAVRILQADWQRVAEIVTDDLAATPVPSFLAPAPGACPAVTTLVPIQCFQP